MLRPRHGRRPGGEGLDLGRQAQAHRLGCRLLGFGPLLLSLLPGLDGLFPFQCLLLAGLFGPLLLDPGRPLPGLRQGLRRDRDLLLLLGLPALSLGLFAPLVGLLAQPIGLLALPVGLLALAHRLLALAHGLSALFVGLDHLEHGEDHGGEGQNGEDYRPDPQPFDPPRLALLALLRGLRLARLGEEAALDLGQVRLALGRPELRLGELFAPEQEPRAEAPAFPQLRQLLRFGEVLGLPAGVVRLHRLDQPVMSELEPDRAGALLRPYQMRVEQLRDDFVGEPLALPGALQDLAADVVRGDQLVAEPVAHSAFSGHLAAGDTRHRVL
ncbi:MAG: hypothetical protein GY856_00090, partial [bacterium]|nr:hypothetical protein [bacterium]